MLTAPGPPAASTFALADRRAPSGTVTDVIATSRAGEPAACATVMPAPTLAFPHAPIRSHALERDCSCPVLSRANARVTVRLARPTDTLASTSPPSDGRDVANTVAR